MVVRPASVVAGNKLMKVANAAPVRCRIGVAVVKHGDFNSSSTAFGLTGPGRDSPGRLRHPLQPFRRPAANIDVGVSRSTDGGRTWSDVKIAIDDSKIDPSLGATKGVGDPAILVDEKTGRIWVAAIWSHRHSIWGSKSGDNSPEVCGQLVLAYSDDDGLTWSKPIN
ncbi:MAG: exo-alpha-sialidase, partial [Akkermansia sp.]